MSRSDSNDKIMLQHIEWCEYALVIEEQGHKGDQTGESKYGKHVYANPYEPAVCPVLALAVLLFGYPERRNGLNQLFIGPDNKSRFGRCLRQVLSKLSDYELQLLGCPIGDIGQVNGPNPVSVFLRMGQSLGQLKDRYIHVGEGADQLCGRMVAGLPFDSEEFGVLPPHFPPSLSGEMNQQYWGEIVCGYDQYPAGAKTIFPFLLASLLHHENYLRTNLNENHPIFVVRVFTNNRLLHRLRGKTILAIGASPIANLKATGIPPHLAIAGKIKKLIETLGLMETRICSLESSLKIESEKLLRSIKDDIPILVAQEIRKSLVVEGAVPFSLRDMDGLRSELFACIDARLTHFTNSQNPVQTATSESNEPDNLEWKAWCWNDGLIAHCVPENWEFPVLLTVKSMWNLWFYGNKTSGIRPYRCITKRDLSHQYHMRHTRTSIVMKSLIDIAVERSLISDGPKRAANAISDLSIAMSDKLFEAAYSVLINRLYPSSNPSREEHLTCGTIYNRLVKFKRSKQHHS
ncbi:hypothetical protein AeRB84_000266 [Aphanomyces euteiches]|nr:hypothetical protein AeRB84_000266 [Aphanomyces euteiches]